MTSGSVGCAWVDSGAIGVRRVHSSWRRTTLAHLGIFWVRAGSLPRD